MPMHQTVHISLDLKRRYLDEITIEIMSISCLQIENLAWTYIKIINLLKYTCNCQGKQEKYGCLMWIFTIKKDSCNFLHVCFSASSGNWGEGSGNTATYTQKHDGQQQYCKFSLS